jgi:hypothetical protein
MITLSRCLRIAMHGHDELCPNKDSISVKNDLCVFCELIVKARLNGYNSGYKDGYNDALEGDM